MLSFTDLCDYYDTSEEETYAMLESYNDSPVIGSNANPSSIEGAPETTKDFLTAR